ncbi:MAG TPA: hypothetical protein VGR55_00590 [Candidatus Acidoferrum sp.]|nr:hypothetical protein [Candidatus Acidoferrum sp.]
MPRLKRKWMVPQAERPASAAPVVTTSLPYFRMKDGKATVGVPFWTLYGLYKRGELRAAPLTTGGGGALYVKRSDFDELWKRKLAET